MKNKHRPLCLLIALLMFFTLCGCTSDPGNQPGSKPPGSGEMPQGNPPEKPDGNPPEKPGGSGAPDKPGEGGPGQSVSITYNGANVITMGANRTDETYKSATSDESALLISTDAAVSITNPKVTKTGDSDGGEKCSFYGLNAAVLVKDGSSTIITGGTITSSAKGANAVFCYGGNGGNNGADGDGTEILISDTVITTTGDGSGGIMTAGGGQMHAYDLTVTTSGRSSAPIRTDRGGGTVMVDGGTYNSNGLGSPAIYSTAEISVSNAVLISNLSEGVCIEGKNSVTLTNCALTANNTQRNGNARFLDTIMIYQSMSGDAASGTSLFTMTEGTLTSKSGHVFHVTNTNAVITLSDVVITNTDSENVLLSVCDDGWNGAENKAVVNAAHQQLSGKILVGDNSSLALNLSDSSGFTGSIDGQIVNAAGEQVSQNTGNVAVSIDNSSSWILTADSYITSFEGNASSIISNGFKLYVNGEVLEGTK